MMRSSRLPKLYCSILTRRTSLVGDVPETRGVGPANTITSRPPY